MAVERRSEVLADFTGGMVVRRAATGFEDSQWADLYGFVLEDSGELRSQWALQRVKGISDAVAVGTYLGHSNRRFLVAVTSSGDIKWCEAPNAKLPSTDAGMTPTWTSLANADASTPTNAGDVSARRPLCTVPLRQASTAGFRSGLLFNSISLDHNAATLMVYEGDAGSLRFVETLDHWPATVDEESLPFGEVAALWNGVLVLGDVDWKDDVENPLSLGNHKRAKNGLLMSEPGNPFRFDPDSFLHIGDPHCRITGLRVIDAGLLVLTGSQASGTGGVYLLRGTPADYSLEALREGTGASPASDAFWSHTGTVCWVTEFGEVWQTDGSQIVRMDWQGLGFDDRDTPADGVGDFGPFLLVTRDDRMMCLRALEEQDEGAWTELALGGLTDINMQHGGMLQDCFYFLAGGQVWRWAKPQQAGAPSERGSGTQGAVELRAATRTLEGGDGHVKTFWTGVGVRASAGATDPESALLKRLELAAGPARDSTAPSLTRTATLDLAPAGERLRGDFQARGIGPAREMAVTAVFEGDVVVEQVTAFYEQGQPSGSTEGV